MDEDLDDHSREAMDKDQPLQLILTSEADGGDHHDQEHATQTPSPTPSPCGAFRLGPPGRDHVPGRRAGLPPPPAQGSKVRQHRSATLADGAQAMVHSQLPSSTGTRIRRF